MAKAVLKANITSLVEFRRNNFFDLSCGAKRSIWKNIGITQLETSKSNQSKKYYFIGNFLENIRVKTAFLCLSDFFLQNNLSCKNR